MTDLPPLGIDISKLKFNACLLRQGGKLRHKVFPNTPAGFSQFSEWLEKQGAGRAHACMEATGTYYEALASYLHPRGHAVSVVNPAAVRDYARSRLSRTKTDRVDAALIAGFCAERRPPAWRPPAPELRELQALVRRLDALQEMRTMEGNRLSSGVTVAAVALRAGRADPHLYRRVVCLRPGLARSISESSRGQRARPQAAANLGAVVDRTGRQAL